MAHQIHKSVELYKGKDGHEVPYQYNLIILFFFFDKTCGIESLWLVEAVRSAVCVFSWLARGIVSCGTLPPPQLISIVVGGEEKNIQHRNPSTDICLLRHHLKALSSGRLYDQVCPVYRFQMRLPGVWR